MLSWRQALLLSAGLLLLDAGVRRGPSRLRRTAPYLREAAVLAAGYAGWQLLLDALVTGTAGAVDRGRWLWQAERDLRIPSEGWFQQPFLHHRLLGRAADVYSGGAHFPFMGVFLAWLFVRHRERYAELRTSLFVMTAAAALVQSIPVAPPRLVPGIGVLDQPRLLGQSVYNPGGLSDPGQLIAMPSDHVAWAGLVAYGVWRSCPRTGWARWGRWLGPAHLFLTVAVVVGTGNHYWADAAAGLAVLAGGAAAGRFLAGRFVSGRPVGRWLRRSAPWRGVATPWPAGTPLLLRRPRARSRIPSSRPAAAARPPDPGSSHPDRGWPTPGRRR